MTMSSLITFWRDGIQYYEMDLAEKQKVELAPDPITYSMDVLVGNPHFRNRGIAAQAIQLLQQDLQKNTKAERLVLLSAKENASALRCYEKCGFRKVRDVGEDLLVMDYWFAKWAELRVSETGLTRNETAEVTITGLLASRTKLSSIWKISKSIC